MIRAEQHVGLPLRSRHVDARCHPPDNRQCVAPGAELVHDRGHVGVDPNARREHGTKIEVTRHHADDGRRLASQADSGPDNCGIGVEVALPERRS